MEDSSKLLRKFQTDCKNVTILNGEKRNSYICDDTTHNWTNDLVFKVIGFKNKIIKYSIENNYDYLFFIDSDIVIHPNLIEHLKSQKKDIISEIFWTQWHPGGGYGPNVWMYDQYDLVPKQFGEILTKEENDIRMNQFLNMLRKPGVYEVGGLGACTLISMEALQKGVDFSPIKNLTIPGEDRYFCIRAVVLGFNLYVDTFYPAYHIYREQNLAGVPDYIRSCEKASFFTRQIKESNNRLTLSMIVKNESGRYLERILQKLRGVIDEAVIIDDGSTDNTVEICKKGLEGIPLHLIQNNESMFHNEVELRKKQWEETIKTSPDWILNLDADEMFDDSFYQVVRELINRSEIDVYLFRLYDMWDEEHYREDKYWNAHQTFRPFLLRYQPYFEYQWMEARQHCGRFPSNILQLPKGLSDIRVKHYGWSSENDRMIKYNRYKKLDPDAEFGIKEQYESILDRNPNLLLFE